MQKAAPKDGLSLRETARSYLAAAEDSSTETPGPMVDESETFLR